MKVAATCYIFAATLNEEGAFCLCLTELGTVLAPPQWRLFSEILSLQYQAKTILVIPTIMATLHEVTLPRLTEHQARAAIPYALEDFIAQPVSEVHIAFDNAHYQEGAYFVVVIDKAYLQGIIGQCEAMQLTFEIITLDFFALKPNEICITQNAVMVNEPQFKGAMRLEWLDVYQKQAAKDDIKWFAFKDSVALEKDGLSLLDRSVSLWIAERLSVSKPINLCQGPFQQGKKKMSFVHWYKIAGFVFVGWLLSSVLVKGLYLYALTAQEAALDKKIAVIYHTFFPNATRVIHPRFRIQQWLKTGKMEPDSALLWSLLDKWVLASKGMSFIIQSWHFQNHVLSISLTANDFSMLEQVQRRLQAAHVTLKSSQASTYEHEVKARLELQL